MTRVLLAGMSTRAAAESAARAGFSVTAIDGFADRDQHPAVRAFSLPRDFGAPVNPAEAARASQTIECDAVAYLASFENHPSAVATLASGRALWGNPPDVLRRVRDPLLLADTFRRRGIAVPEAYVASSASLASLAERRWLVKPLASGGGRGIREWQNGGLAPGGCYLQQLIDGMSGSVVFVAARRRAAVLGVTRQLTGEAAFGSSGYGYAGSILVPGTPAAAELARVLAEEFDLEGVNGVDYVSRDGVLYPIEVNPRWCASMELVEHGDGVSVFAAHAAACADGVLPDVNIEQTRRAMSSGKAIIFARQDLVVGDTDPWLADPFIRDVPHQGEAIATGRPVCTIFASGPDEEGCYQALGRRAAQLYEQLAAWSVLR